MVDLRSYRKWFYAAAAYNFVWGALVSVMPNLLFTWLRMPIPNYPSLMECIGMIVGVYGLGYLLVARDPERFGPFAWIGLLGKVLGPLGFIWAAATGQLPWRFGWLNVTNDLIWLPVFIPFSVAVAKREIATYRESTSQT